LTFREMFEILREYKGENNGCFYCDYIFGFWDLLFFDRNYP
jgi:hypothetical protein